MARKPVGAVNSYVSSPGVPGLNVPLDGASAYQIKVLPPGMQTLRASVFRVLCVPTFPESSFSRANELFNSEREILTALIKVRITNRMLEGS